MGGAGEFAVKIPALEELGLMLERVFAGVVSYDASGIDHHALSLGALPVASPPRDVIADRVLFVDVGLAPSIGAPVPGQAARLRC
jgi:hypothetical protein